MQEYKGRPAIIYGRFSSKKQKSSISRKRQIDQAMEFVAKHELSLLQDGVWFDAGISGYRGKHREQGELGKLLDSIQEGIIPENSVLIIESIDRLSRENPLDAFTLIKDIIDSGLSVVTIHDQQRYDRERMQHDQSALFLLIAGMQRAHSEAEARSERSKASWLYKKEMISNGEAPKMKRPFWINRDCELISDRADLVHRIFTMYIDERKGIRPIAQALNAAGERPPTTRAGEWRWTQVSRVLKDPRVLGLFEATQIYPPAVSRETFAQAQEIMKNQRGKGPVGTNWSSALRGVAFCHSCDSSLRSHNTRDISRTMHCRRSREGACETSGGINYKLVTLFAVWVAAQEIAYNQGQKQARKKPEASVQPEIDALNNEIEKQIELASLAPTVTQIGIKIQKLQERKEQLITQLEEQLKQTRVNSFEEQMRWLHEELPIVTGEAVTDLDKTASQKLNHKFNECGIKVTWDGKHIHCGDHKARREHKHLVIEGEGVIKLSDTGTQELGGGWWFLANLKSAPMTED